VPQQLDPESRLGIPQRFLARLAWFQQGEQNKLLLDLSPSGMFAILGWGDRAGYVLERRRDLAMDAPSSHSSAQQIARLDLRYLPATLDSGCRVRLTHTVLLHLEEEPNTRPWFFIVSLPDRVEIWSRSYRARQVDGGDSYGPWDEE